MSNTNPDLLLKKFKEKLENIKSLVINVGIPKEATSQVYGEAQNYSQERKIAQREEREEMADVLLKTNIREQKRTKAHEEVYIADIAFKNNFGSFRDKIPPRPFGSTVIPRYKAKIERIISKELKAYTEGKQSLEVAYNRIGLAVEGFMKDNLTNGNWKANAPLTVFLKGSSHPLIDSGQLRQRVTYIIKNKED